MAVAMVAAMVVTLAAAVVGWGCWRCMWRPWQLVRACSKQGIPGITLYRLPPLFHAEGSSWKWLNSMPKGSKMFFVRFGKLVRLIVLDPLTLQHVLTQNADCYEKASFVTALGILGSGVFSASGNTWSHQRQLLGPCFYMKGLKDHFETIKMIVKEDVESWIVHHGKVMDAHKLLLMLTVKLIGHVAFGAKIENETASLIFKSFDSYLHQYKNLVCSPFFNFFGYGRKSKQILEDEQHLSAEVKQLVSRSCPSPYHDKKKQALAIDLMIEAAKKNGKLNANLILDNSATLLLAGHETTASLVTWTVYLLGTNLSWQKQARAEVQGVQDLDVKKMGQLKTLGMILWEVLRLFPPQPIIGRRCVRQNTVIEGVIIPKDIEVIALVPAMHRNKEAWGEDSDEFKPSRFAKGINKACKIPASFLPFGSGPRTCLGQTLALLEAKVILYFMLRNYSWEVCSDYQHCPDVTLTLQPRFGMPITLTSC